MVISEQQINTNFNINTKIICIFHQIYHISLDSNIWSTPCFRICTAKLLNDSPDSRIYGRELANGCFSAVGLLWILRMWRNIESNLCPREYFRCIRHRYCLHSFTTFTIGSKLHIMCSIAFGYVPFKACKKSLHAAFPYGWILKHKSLH